ncbi:NAD-dependent epimerase [Actinomadura alba]|uniref:NAD-dependent epimerase n=1 Tax=Actinomadura alba TaxID=406431 RepID=A0ABR7M114_9ACTN|nr:NAD-dependent epimerase [Actinomadura alba]MBC6470583.1 NAD-dependent epimerase [Actinomadura alba]
MKLLIIGGTSFVGRAVATEAVRRGHEVATFNRGRTGPDVPGVTAIRGDRSTDEGVRPLAGRSFDAALDPGGLVPAHVRRTAQALTGTVPYYAYVSTTAVYRDWTNLPWDEDSPLHDGAPDDDGDPADLRLLAPRKAGCERAVREAYGTDASLILRPGLIVGPYDNVGMLPWWLTRIQRGGRVLAPGDPGRPLQVTDARDIAVFLLDQIETGRAGVFNTVPDEPDTTIGGCLAACAAATSSGAELVWTPDEFLMEQGAQPWTEVPFWLPSAANPAAGWPASGAAASAAGLKCRPIGDTVEATWAWLRDGGVVRRMAGMPVPGIDGGKEARILDAWTEASR